MKDCGRVVPIFGIAAGRFNVIYPKRRHDPFVSVRNLYPFDVDSIRIEEVMGTVIRVNGIDKELVGETAARIRSLRKPDVYKLKGIRYRGERLIKKVGKAAGK